MIARIIGSVHFLKKTTGYSSMGMWGDRQGDEWHNMLIRVAQLRALVGRYCDNVLTSSCHPAAEWSRDNRWEKT